MANLTMTLSTFLCRVLPILSDLKRKACLKGFSVSMASTPFGSGIVLDTAISKLAFVVSRLMMHLAIVWVLWSLKRVTRSMIGALQKHGAVETRAFNILVLAVEVAFGATAAFTILSSIAASSPSLAAPQFVALAFAGKDFFQNYFAGFFLLAAQPIQPGHIVSIPCYYKGREPIAAISWTDGKCRSGWFEGVCESVGLTYTVLRNAQCQFRIPNSMFVKREYLVVDTSQDHASEQCSTKSVENFKIVNNSMGGTMKQSRLTKLTNDWRGRFGIGQQNSTSNSYKLHQVLAYGLPKLC
ncbi:hypothetical protein O6H91_Y419900 [Diphasiastrum complanatum]|nr:hypothetical protein O6H91_Y419900 [Diphasiastrum complanatum]